MANPEEDKNKDKDHDKTFTIIVNGTEHTVPNDVVTYEQLANIAFPGHPHNPDIIFLESFDKAASKPHQGSLVEGGSVTVKKHGTVFDVTQTNRS